MKKKVKQIMSTALIIALTVTMFGNIRFCYVVKADTAKCGVDVDDLLEQAEDGMSDEEMEIIENDVEVLETFGITMLAKDINIVSEENSFIYEIKYAGQQNEVSNIEYTSEGVSFDCAQGDLKNTVEIKEDGNVYLDGCKVDINDDYAENNCEYVFKENDSQRWFQKKCPYGKASEYTKNGGSKKCADINLKHAIKDISMSAFITILCTALGAGAVASFCASAAYTFITSYRPGAKGLSYRVKKNYHKSCGWLSGSYIRRINKEVTKYSYTWYTKYNYKGKTCKNTAYYIVERY